MAIEMRLGSRVRQAITCRDGGATVEFVIWMPFFLMLFAAVVDVSLLLNWRSRMFDAAGDAGRMVALNRMSTSEAEQFAIDRFDGKFMEASSELDLDAGYITVTLRTRYSVPMVFGDDFMLHNGLLKDDWLSAAMTTPLENAALEALKAAAEAQTGGSDTSGLTQ